MTIPGVLLSAMTVDRQDDRDNAWDTLGRLHGSLYWACLPGAESTGLTQSLIGFEACLYILDIVIQVVVVP